jgi:methionyl-tRNA synthetase
MLEKYCSGNIPQGRLESDNPPAKAIAQKIEKLDSEISSCLNPLADYNFSLGFERIWELVNMANKYVEEAKPWNLAKEKKTAELNQFLLTLVSVLRKAKETLLPFLPQTASLIEEQLGDKTIKKGNPLFPRIDAD